MTSPLPPFRVRLLGWIAIAAILALAAVLRFDNSRNNDPPDDAITIDVVAHLRHSGSWDDNWAKSHLRDQTQSYNQYNFSSYIYSTFLFYKAAKLVPGTLAWRSDNDGVTLYHFWSSLLATLAVLPAMALAWRTAGRAAGLTAGLLTATCLLLVQDAHYIRPESFVTCLTVVAVALSWPAVRLSPARIVGAAGLVGLLIASKVSMLLLAWVPAVPVLAVWPALSLRLRLRWAGGVCAGILAGFVAGVPYALVHPDEFLYGIGRLMSQYGGSHLPHGHWPERAVGDLLVLYCGQTFGWPMLAAAALGVAILIVRRQWAILALVGGPPALFGAYFATKHTFFERNLSHVAPLFFVLAAVGCGEASRWLGRRLRLPAAPVTAVLALLLAAPSLLLSRTLVEYEFSGQSAAKYEQYRARIRAEHPDADWLPVILLHEDPLTDLGLHFRYGEKPVLLEVLDYGDDATTANLRRLPQEFTLTTVGEYHGSFDRMAASTLRAYFPSHTLYFLVTANRP